MNEQVVSLGGGCDVATELFSQADLPKTTHFFDYLWNLDGGLCNVINIIRERFAGFDSLDDYVFRAHPEWNTDQTLGPRVIACANQGSTQLVHRKYQDIAFVHYEHDTELVESFRRKAQRFLELLESKDPVSFVYYRQYHGPINGQYVNGLDFDIDAKMRHFQAESEELAASLKTLYPQLPFRLVSAFAAPAEELPEIAARIEAFVGDLPQTTDLIFRRVYRRRSRRSLDSWRALLPDLLGWSSRGKRAFVAPTIR
jgi:hypothetical protein